MFLSGPYVDRVGRKHSGYSICCVELYELISTAASDSRIPENYTKKRQHRDGHSWHITVLSRQEVTP